MSEEKEWQQEVHAALQAMMQAIAEGSGDIATRVREIDGLTQRMPNETPPMLRHYVERRSYAKALDFIEGRDESVSANC
ncbi:MAG: hypothetical protein ACI906_002006 [Candidatus Latescibacterota bacterium]|jgi:hypothetical protein|tara:strand:+ start:17 stop:253 length:237 start_codon:yes stop_codon:yes gene_type:complete